jgi:hypothetical protein
MGGMESKNRERSTAMAVKLVDPTVSTYTLAPVWDDAEEWEPEQQGSTAHVAPPVHALDDAGSLDAPAPVAAPLAGDAGRSILASLWLGLFVAYAATALPLIVWAMTSMAG